MFSHTSMQAKRYGPVISTNPSKGGATKTVPVSPHRNRLELLVGQCTHNNRASHRRVINNAATLRAAGALRGVVDNLGDGISAETRLRFSLLPPHSRTLSHRSMKKAALYQGGFG